MKRFLTLVALLLTFCSFGQLQKWHKVTNYASTSNMVWSTIDQQTLFFDNKDFQPQNAIWDIVLDESTNTGFITSGAITYRVNSISIEEREGIKMILMNAFNERINAPVLIIASTIEGRFKLGVYVDSHQKVYYFYE
jgi:hypothetical protein